MPRVVGLQELCSQPRGAIFSTFDPNVVAGLYRFQETCNSGPHNVEHYGGPHCDFFYQTLLAEVDDNGPRGDGVVFRDPRRGGRWGNFDPGEQFVLYGEGDLKVLAELLTRGSEPCPASSEPEATAPTPCPTSASP